MLKLRGMVLAGAMVIGCGAAAADGPRYNWSGLYFGGTVGAAIADFKGDYVTTPTLNHHDARSTNPIYGVTAGLQQQWGQFVLGVEASYSDLGGASASKKGASSGCLGGVPALLSDCRAEAGTLFTIGPRIGYAPSNQWLLFATGGYATAQVNTQVINRATGAEIGASGLRQNGLFFGGGVDYAIAPNWTLGLEYQHVSLHSGRHFDTHFGGCCTVTAETRDMKADFDIVRLRGSYKFNWGN